MHHRTVERDVDSSGADAPPDGPRRVAGIDGKTYTLIPRVEPRDLRPRLPEVAAPRDYDRENAEQESAAFARAVVTLARLTSPEGRDVIRRFWTRGHLGASPAALDYASWDAYCAEEFAGQRMVRLDRDQRREIVAQLRSAGMSTRAIGAGLGVDHGTVVRDAQASSGPDGPDAPVTAYD